MEQITNRDGVLFYGDHRCKDAEEAYACFRKDYHEGLGRAVFKRLDRLGRRKERVHWHGFVFSGNPFDDADRFSRRNPVRCRIMGIIHICYVRVISIEDYLDVPDDEFEDWLDWVFSEGSRMLTTVGTRDKAGRTNKRLKTRYR